MAHNLVSIPDNDSSVEETDYITREQLLACLPDKKLKNGVTDELLELVNSEPHSELRRIYKDNILTYSTVLMQGRYSLSAYVRAVKFVSLKLMGVTSSKAYARVFPDRYQNLVDKGADSSRIATFADNYSKNKLVVAILEQTLVPTHILNAGIYQEAINVQAELMRNAKSDHVRQKAAESLITNLKAPDIAKAELSINYSSNTIDELRSVTQALAKQQKALIEGGFSNAQDIAQSSINATKVIDVSYEEVDKKELKQQEQNSLEKVFSC